MSTEVRTTCASKRAQSSSPSFKWAHAAALAFALCSSVALHPAQAEAELPIPVLDLNVGLERAAAIHPSALTTNQADYAELDKGRVSGVVAPFPLSQVGADPDHELLAFRSALLAGGRFDPFGCAAHSSRIRIWFEFIDPEALAAAPTSVSLWVTRGVKVFRLVGTEDGPLATSAASPPAALVSGLTPLGRDVLARIFAAHALIDVSRLSSLALDEVIQLALAAHSPVIATHVAARALAEQPGNLTDAQLADVARTGGIIALTFDRRQIAPGRTARIDHVVHQLKYLVSKIGSEHVALGSGFETGEDVPLDLESAAQFPRLARALTASGFRSADIARIFHGNAERVLCSD